MKKRLIAVVCLAVSGCSLVIPDYEMGDLSERYCSATLPAARDVLRQRLEQRLNVELSPDYCAMFELTKRLLAPKKAGVP